MNRYLVRNPEGGIQWEGAEDVIAADPHEAAEKFARRQCASDPEYYRRYEDGRRLETKEWNSGRVTVVKVDVTFDPVFHSRIEPPAHQP